MLLSTCSIYHPIVRRYAGDGATDRTSMGTSSSFLVYFAGTTTLADASRSLARSLSVVEAGDLLRVRWRDGSEPEFTVGLGTGDHVAREAAEIGARHGVDEFNAFDRRFEVGIDDLDAALDETNTLIEVQLTLQDLTSGYLVLSWNGAVQAPGG